MSKGTKDSTLKIQERHINEIKPYWKNPRKITPEAVKAVKRSIERYGYNVPIVIDKEGVIIAGHVRYKALRELQQETVSCVISDLTTEEAREYRIADNKTQELTDWDMADLEMEMKQIYEIENMLDFFDQSDLEKLVKDVAFDETVLEDEYKDDERLYKQYEEEGVAPTGVSEEDRMKRLEEKRKQLEKMEDQAKGKYADWDKQVHSDIIQLECPHCGKEYNVSFNEIKNNKDKQWE